MFGNARRQQEGARRRAVDVARTQAQGEAQDEARRLAARGDKERRRRLSHRRPWNRRGLGRRWTRLLDRADGALLDVTEALGTVARASEPGRAFAQAHQHLTVTHRSIERALARCQDIALAAGQLDDTLRSLGRDRGDDRDRLAKRLGEAAERIRHHVVGMESAALAARELALQSALTSRDDDAVMEIDARLRTVSEMLDIEGPDTV